MNNILNSKDLLNITGTIYNISKKDEALCNEVFTLNAENGQFLIKIAKNAIRQDELEKEFKLLNQLKTSMVLPQIYLYKHTKNNSYLLMEYIDGYKPIVFTDETLLLMAKSLRNIHNATHTDNPVNFEKLLTIAKQNMINKRLDPNEFNNNNKRTDPKEILNFLIENPPKATASLVHGDFRPKNMLIKNDKLYVIDWGLSFIGDPYYDLAIIKWYFSNNEFDKFIKFYGIESIDQHRLQYNELLSKFLNV